MALSSAGFTKPTQVATTAPFRFLSRRTNEPSNPGKTFLKDQTITGRIPDVTHVVHQGANEIKPPSPLFVRSRKLNLFRPVESLVVIIDAEFHAFRAAIHLHIDPFTGMGGRGMLHCVIAALH
jgi:hypothetical protein